MFNPGAMMVAMDHNQLDALIARDISLPEQAKDVLMKVLEIFGCCTGTIHFWNTQSELLELAAQQGIPDFLLEKVAKIPIGKGIAGAAAQQRDAVQICNLQTDDSGVAKPEAKRTEVAGSVAVPIQHGETLLGTIGIGKREPYDFNEDEVAQLNRIADWIASRC